MPACLLHRPDDLSKPRDASAYIRERKGARFRDQCIGASLHKKLGERRMWLVVWNQDGRESVEGAGEEEGEKLDAVGEVDGHSLCAMVFQVRADDGDFFCDCLDFML